MAHNLYGFTHFLHADQVAVITIAIFSDWNIEFHFIIAFVVAYLVAGNLLAAALGTFFGNPLSFPIIWASTYTTGSFIIHGSNGPGDGQGLQSVAEADWFELGWGGAWDLINSLWEPLFLPMLVGSVPLGSCFGIAAYLLTRWASKTFKDARARRMSAKASKATQTGPGFGEVITK